MFCIGVTVIMRNFQHGKPIELDKDGNLVPVPAVHCQVFIKNEFSDLSPVYYGEAVVSRDYFEVNHLRTVSCINLFYVEDGTCYLELDDKEYIVKQGDFFVVPMGANAQLVPMGEHTMTHRWIGFTGALSSDFVAFPTVFTLPPQLTERLYSSETATRNLASRLVSDLYLIHSYMKESISEKPNYVQKVIDYISTSYMKKISIVQIAAELNLDRYYLTKLFKSKMHMSIQDYIVSFRVAKGKRYLKHNYSVTDAARLSGFCNRSNFSKAFNRELGVSPSQWVKLTKKDVWNRPK